ncbi:MAG TPA: lysylphosphatidylglycerol synthase transmembrane domain-containing protein [Solirubrobacterales bacterium]|nr:lysylphosphatidylglycerol synthase transmembrane domain-containing protein [Solirubrobacterales bacterium]
MATPDGNLIRGSRSARISLGRAFEWGTSLACVAFLILWFRDKPLPDLFATPATCGWFLAATGIFAISICLAAERWHFLLIQQASDSTRGTAYRSIGLGEIANALLPMRAGDAVRVGVVSEREKRPLSGSAGVLIVERGLGLTTQIVFLTITGALALSQIPPLLRSPWAAAAAVALVAVGMAVIGWGMVLFARVVLRFARWRVVASLAEPFAGLTANGAVVCASLSAAVFCAEGLAWWAAGNSAGVGLSPLDAIFIQTLATLATIIPAGPGSVGTLDAAIVVALGSVGQPESDGLAFILVLRIAILAACIGFWLCISGGDLVRRVRAQSKRQESKQ